MGQEIEKKFLVRGDFKAAGQKSIRITQGYLCSVPERTVRVRVKGDKGYERTWPSMRAKRLTTFFLLGWL